jgi:hypothetical protein
MVVFSSFFDVALSWPLESLFTFLLAVKLPDFLLTVIEFLLEKGTDVFRTQSFLLLVFNVFQVATQSFGFVNANLKAKISESLFFFLLLRTK